jgi:phage-related protein (TIGR01555 family)
MYNSLVPSRSDFYKPSSWWVMGEHWDATRLVVIITREVPDIFKPGFNFSGLSLSQLAEPYVNNWLRTRQSVSDLINNFSIVVLKTAMDQVLTGGDDGTNLFARIKLFTATRSNKGVMALDKDREELEQIAVPLGGLHELQSQALELLCAVSREPATVMTGISPSGFGNVADGEIRIWYDWIHAQQEAHYRVPVETMLKLVQLSLYGEIDPEITFDFNPLYEMTEEQESTIRVNDSIRAGNLIDRGVIDPQEERERLARDPESGYQGIDILKEIPLPNEAELGSNLARGTA